jgi:hypothetical protein
MSRQLAFSSTVSVMIMAAFALSTSVTATAAPKATPAAAVSLFR